MKKLYVSLIAVCLFSTTAFADFLSVDFGLGYMRFDTWTTYNSDALADNVKADLNNLGDGEFKISDFVVAESYNAFALGASLRFSLLYTNFNVGFPTRTISTGYDPIAKALPSDNARNAVKSQIIDWQVGLGFDIIDTGNLKLFTGIGLAFGFVNSTRQLGIEARKALKINSTAISSFHEKRTLALGGVGIDIGLQYYFTNMLGFVVDIKDTAYTKLSANRKYFGTLQDGRTFEKSIKDIEGNSDKKLIKNSWSNCFTVRAGLAIKI